MLVARVSTHLFLKLLLSSSFVLTVIEQSFALAIADWVGSWFGLTVYIRIYGTPSEVALLKYHSACNIHSRDSFWLTGFLFVCSTAESVEYASLVPEQTLGGWVNKVHPPFLYCRSFWSSFMDEKCTPGSSKVCPLYSFLPAVGQCGIYRGACDDCCLTERHFVPHLCCQGSSEVAEEWTGKDAVLLALCYWVLLTTCAPLQVVTFEGGHFDMYAGKPYFDAAVDHQVRFFHKHL